MEWRLGRLQDVDDLLFEGPDKSIICLIWLVGAIVN